MESKHTIHQNRCLFCGLFFRPNNRVGSRQKSCKRPGCQKKRRRVQQEKWRKANPCYFEGRYEYLKEWRKAHPDYQKRWRTPKGSEIQTQIPPVSPIKSIRLNMRANHPVREIQTLVLTLVKSGQSLWIDGARMHPGWDTNADGRWIFFMAYFYIMKRQAKSYSIVDVILHLLRNSYFGADNPGVRIRTETTDFKRF